MNPTTKLPDGRVTIMLDQGVVDMDEGRVYIQRDPDTGDIVHYQLARGKVKEFRLKKGGAGYDSPGIAADSLESPAARWIKEYKRLHGEFVQPLHFVLDGREEWRFVKQFSAEDFDLMGSVFGMSGYSLEDLSSHEAQSAFSVALLYVGAVKNVRGDSAFFKTPAEAEEFYRLPGIASEMARGMRNVLLTLNRFEEETQKKVMGVEAELSPPSTPTNEEAAPMPESFTLPSTPPPLPANLDSSESGSEARRGRFVRWGPQWRFWRR